MKKVICREGKKKTVDERKEKKRREKGKRKERGKRSCCSEKSRSKIRWEAW